MSADSRVHFFERQFLRAQDLADEQAYHLAMRRRHNIAHHSWGIVTGLEVGQDGGALFVLPGVAVDGYGREAALQNRTPLDARAFDTFEASSLDVWLYYERFSASPAPSGYASCNGSGGYYRWTEAPRVEMRRRTGGFLDPRRPPGVPPEALEFALGNPPPDDPRQVWPVYLGTIQRDREKPENEQFTIDLAQRPYAGVTAEVIDHPAVAARVELGSRSTRGATRLLDGKEVEFSADPGRRFAVFVPEDVAVVPATNSQGQVQPRLEINAEGDLRLRGGVVVNGGVAVAGGAVQFVAGQAVSERCDPEDPAIYRVRDSANGDRLRIDLGSKDLTKRELVIGFSLPDGKFQPCLKIEVADAKSGDSPARVTVFGDLVVEGQLDAQRPDVKLSEDAARAIQASFMSGVAAAMT